MVLPISNSDELFRKTISIYLRELNKLKFVLPLYVNLFLLPIM